MDINTTKILEVIYIGNIVGMFTKTVIEKAGLWESWRDFGVETKEYNSCTVMFGIIMTAWDFRNRATGFCIPLKSRGLNLNRWKFLKASV